MKWQHRRDASAGKAGLRAYFTDTKSTGLIIDDDYTPIGEAAYKATYSGVLPTLNAALEITPDFLVRIAASKNINRPPLGSMSASGSATFEDGSYYVNVGNPDLKPYRDTAFDISAEWSFGDVGMVSIGLFHKDIKNLISGQTLFNVPLSATGLPTSMLPGLTPDTIIAEYTRPVNLDDARVTGIEAAAQTTFKFLPAPFDQFGMSTNVTRAKRRLGPRRISFAWSG